MLTTAAWPTVTLPPLASSMARSRQSRCELCHSFPAAGGPQEGAHHPSVAGKQGPFDPARFRRPPPARARRCAAR